ncbi:hypothetical protein N0V93_009772 [Gnomoniopsis smithogilvyi]|uniref:Uncharacterized protein n=1 Tax=Gnomoniopsis smithogilvyi TaxID=1191159 RepID=A0A9W8YLG8_9PEZI|nr:hypothetical protein N0V93_009772 [Gnomoniopsis smithogilvyi]
MREASGVPIWSQEGQPDPGIGPSRTQEIFESPAFNPTGYYALTEMELQELFAHTAEISSADFEQFADSAYHSLETNTEAIDDRSKGKGKEVDADFNA